MTLPSGAETNLNAGAQQIQHSPNHDIKSVSIFKRFNNRIVSTNSPIHKRDGQKTNTKHRTFSVLGSAWSPTPPYSAC